MRLILISLLVLALGAGTATAALDMENKSFYAFGTISLPSGDFGDFAGTGFGGGVGLTVPFNEQFNFRGEAGYTMFSGKDVDVGLDEWSHSFSMIPIIALAEFHPSADSPAYALGGAGFFIMRSSVEGETTIEGQTVSFDESDSSTKFGISLGGGFQATEKLAVEGRYNIVNDADQISIFGIYSF